MKAIARRLLPEGSEQHLVKIGDGYRINTIDPANPDKPNWSIYPLPLKDVEAFLADCELIDDPDQQAH